MPKKVELPLGLEDEFRKELSCLSVSHGACVSPIVDLLDAFCAVSQQHIFGDTDTLVLFRSALHSHWSTQLLVVDAMSCEVRRGG